MIITTTVVLFSVSSSPSLQSSGGQPNQYRRERSLPRPQTAGETVSTPTYSATCCVCEQEKEAMQTNGILGHVKNPPGYKNALA